jgi:large subunit ribosomal protein L21
MNKYVIVNLAGKQYRLSEGDEFLVDRVDSEEGKTFSVKEVLLIKDGDQLTIGTPFVDGIAVKFKVLENFRGKKIRVAKFKAKSRYRRVKGHRQHLSKLKLVSIN